MKDETQVKDEIILVVKEAIGDNTTLAAVDWEPAELDSNDVDHIAETVADRLYADGWRKEKPQCLSVDDETQINNIAMSICDNKHCKDVWGKDVNCICHPLCKTAMTVKKLYETGFRKQSKIVREFTENVKKIIHGFENISQDTDDYLRTDRRTRRGIRRKKGGLMTEKDKIVDIILNTDITERAADRIADALIAAGIGDVTEWKRRTEVAELVVHNLNKIFTFDYQTVFEQAEREIEEEERK